MARNPAVAAVTNEAAATVSVIAGNELGSRHPKILEQGRPGTEREDRQEDQPPRNGCRRLNAAKTETEAAKRSRISVEDPRGFRNSNLADPHEHDEERAHQDLGRPDVTDGREASDCAQHEGTHLRAPLMLTFSSRYRKDSWWWVRSHPPRGSGGENVRLNPAQHGGERGGAAEGEQAARRAAVSAARGSRRVPARAARSRTGR